MQEMIKVAVDAMGGDNAPAEIVKGAIEAVTLRQDIKVFLVGQQEVVKEELAKNSYTGSQIEVIHADEVIETAEPPVMAIRKKKQSSIVVGMNMVKQQEADAFVSAGVWSNIGRRTSHCRKNQGSGTTTTGASDSDGKGRIPAD